MKVYTDGASRGNPGKAGVGVFAPEKNLQHHKYLGIKTNNEAEYLAVIEALKLFESDEKLEFFLDSELVVRQLNGEYKVKKHELKLLYEEIINLTQDKDVSFEWIPRESNKVADSLANKAIDSFNS